MTSREVADEAGVALRIEYLMEIGGAVCAADATKVFRALSKLTGQNYTIENVEGVCIKELLYTQEPQPPTMKPGHSPRAHFTTTIYS